MAFTYDSFYHPFGKGSGIANFNQKINELKDKYFKYISKHIMCSCVYNKFRDSYTFFFKIPSEENDQYPTDIFYDVVIEFIPNKQQKAALKNATSIKNYDIKIFSNSPGFVFTFDYVVKHRYNGFPTCIPFTMYSRVALTQPPRIKNTIEVMTIEKTTWWSFFHLEHNGYFDKDTINTILSNKNESFYIKQMISQPLKLKEVQEMKKLVSDAKKAELNKGKDAKPIKLNKDKNPMHNPLFHSMAAHKFKKLSSDSLKKNMAFKASIPKSMTKKK